MKPELKNIFYGWLAWFIIGLIFFLMGSNDLQLRNPGIFIMVTFGLCFLAIITMVKLDKFRERE